jgi:hypothetical protein
MVSGNSQSASFAAISPISKSLWHFAHEGMEGVGITGLQKSLIGFRKDEL